MNWIEAAGIALRRPRTIANRARLMLQYGRFRRLRNDSLSRLTGVYCPRPITSAAKSSAIAALPQTSAPDIASTYVTSRSRLISWLRPTT